MIPAVVVLAVGNPSRGDDAIGPVLLARLSDWLASRPDRASFRLIEDFQLQIEHALDLQDRALALFIDAGDCTPGPFTFLPTQPVDRIWHSTHALAPGSVLQVYRDTLDAEPPPAFTLCVRGESFDLGEPLSNAARENLEVAFAFLQTLVAVPDWAAWQARCTAGVR